MSLNQTAAINVNAPQMAFSTMPFPPSWNTSSWNWTPASSGGAVPFPLGSSTAHALAPPPASATPLPSALPTTQPVAKPVIGTRKQKRATCSTVEKMRGIRTLRDTLFLQNGLLCDALDSNERYLSYIALDHSNMVTCRRNKAAQQRANAAAKSKGKGKGKGKAMAKGKGKGKARICQRPASINTIVAHINSFSTAIQEAIVTGSGLTTHKSLDLNLFKPVLDMPPGQKENGEPDKELIRQSYGLVDDGLARGLDPHLLVLCTGDGNNENKKDDRGRRLSFPAVAEYALRHGWRVVIYARVGMCNHKLVNLSKSNPSHCALFYIHPDGKTITPALDVDAAGNIIDAANAIPH